MGSEGFEPSQSHDNGYLIFNIIYGGSRGNRAHSSLKTVDLQSTPPP